MSPEENHSDAKKPRGSSTISELEDVIADKRIHLWVHHNKLFFRDPAAVLERKKIDILRDRQDEVLSWLALRAFPSGKKSERVGHSAPRFVPLAFQQESALLYREPNFYGIFAARLRGSLNVDLLSKSLGTIVQRHSALRSKVIVVNGELMQEIEEMKDVGVSIETVGNAAEIDVDSRVNELAAEFVTQWLTDACRTFEARLIQLGCTDHVLVIAWDHLFEDYLSAIVVFRELWIAYRDLGMQKTPSLPKKPMQYCEYALWQRSTYESWLEAHGEYWKTHLADGDCLQLKPRDGSREARPSQNGVFKISFGLTLSRRVHRMAQNERVLPALVILALCVSLLSAWSDQREFIIPFYVLGRHSSRHLHVVGYLAHPLPLRIELREAESFAELLRRVFLEFMSSSERLSNGRSLLEAPNPFESPLIQWYDSSPNPCEAMVPSPEDWNPHNTGLAIEAFPLALPMLEESTVLERLPLMLIFWNSPEGIVGGGVYRSDLFSNDIALAFSKSLKSAAELVVDNRLIPVSAFHKLS